MSEVPLSLSSGEKAHTSYRRAPGPAQDLIWDKLDPIATQGIPLKEFSYDRATPGGHA